MTGQQDDRSSLGVLVVDDNPVIRLGLRLLLDGAPGLRVVGEAGDVGNALDQAQRLDPDVVLLDVRMPGGSGLDIVAELSRDRCVLMLTSSDEDETIRSALALGARGYLVYGTVDETGIVQSIRAAANGGSVLGPGVTEALLRTGKASPESVPGPGPGPDSAPGHGLAARAGLTERERAVMDLLSTGRSNAEIATELFLAPKTVKNHVNRIFAKLHVTTRAQAMALWLGSVVQAQAPASAGTAVTAPPAAGGGLVGPNGAAHRIGPGSGSAGPRPKRRSFIGFSSSATADGRSGGTGEIRC